MKSWSLVLFAAFFCLMTAASGKVAAVDGLVLHLPFDEGQGATAQDISGNNNNGTLMGNPQWVVGYTGSALQFNGAENANYVEVPDDPSLNPETEITCAAWIYFDEFQPTGGIISKYVGSGNQRSYDIYMSHTAGSLALAAGCSSNGLYQLGTSTTEVKTEANALKEGEWQHVATTFKAKEFMRIYVNGVLVAESDAAATESIFDNDIPLWIGTDFQVGGNHSGQPREFTGIIDEVTIFNRALSEAELLQVMEEMTTAPVEPNSKMAVTWGYIKN